jgi:hypothetical protein
VLPIEDTFLYAEPLYIQAAEARMPQLKKVVLAMGNLLIYTDTYDQALAQLSVAMQAGGPPPAAAPATAQAAAASAQAVPARGADQRIEAIRSHLKRYRDLAAQGRWAEAGKELEAIEAEVNRR